MREPELFSLSNGHLALWLHTTPVNMATSELFFSMAVVIPALHDLASALVEVENIVSQHGEF